MRASIYPLILLLCIGTASAQQSRWSAGAVIASEWNSYDSNKPSNIEEKQSITSRNEKYGLRVQYALSKVISVLTGVQYSTRTFVKIQPYEHCYFNPPGTGCTYNLTYLDKVQYQLAELPLVVRVKWPTKGKLSPYLSAETSALFMLNARYSPYPQRSAITDRKNQWWGFSSNVGVGLEYRVTNRWRFNAETTIRTANHLRSDPVLYSNEFAQTNSLNIGAGLYVFYQW